MNSISRRVVLWVVAGCCAVLGVGAAGAQTPPALAPEWETTGVFTGTQAGDEFGLRVALSGDGKTLAIVFRGDSAAIRIMQNVQGTWVVSDVITSPDPDERVGQSVSLSDDGTTLAYGVNRSCCNEDLPGVVRTVALVNGDWIDTGEISSGLAPTSERFGWSVALSADGETLAIGDLGTRETAGHAEVYELENGQWNQVGSALTGAVGASYGQDVALSADGRTLAVGAPNYDFAMFDTGQVQVFQRQGNSWVQLGSDIYGVRILEQVGVSIALSADGTSIALGIPNVNGIGQRPGSARVFDFVGGSWQMVADEILGVRQLGRFGTSIAFSADGTFLAVGEHLANQSTGETRVFQRVGTSWAQIGQAVLAQEGTEDEGLAVALSNDGRTLVSAAPLDLFRERPGSVRAFELAHADVICDGYVATIVGTPSDDTLVGTSGTDVMSGLQGNDDIRGLAGDDVICGGVGDDVIYGGAGFDVMFGAQGNDTIYFANGRQERFRNDTAGGRAFGGIGDDEIIGSTRWDRMQGGSGADELYGFEGRDWIRAGAGNDRINGGANIDDVNGRDGADTIFIDDDDIVRGGAGSQDECLLSPGANPQLLISCEFIAIP